MDRYGGSDLSVRGESNGVFRIAHGCMLVG